MSSIFDLFKQIESKPAGAGPVSFLLAGLGNPGAEYAFTRHNAGFLAVDYIAQKTGVRPDRIRFRALCAELTLAGRRGLLLKPQTYMNNSGEAIREAAAFYKLSPENVLVICDDISLAPGQMRVRAKGSDGGQKGLRSIISCLGSDAFPRIRLGVGAKPHPDYDLADWVLSSFTEAERPLLYARLEDTLPCAEAILSGDIEGAMARFNGRRPV